jgi:hypothetical protein
MREKTARLSAEIRRSYAISSERRASDQQHPAPLAFGPKGVAAVEIELGRERSLRCGVFDRSHSHGSR